MRVSSFAKGDERQQAGLGYSNKIFPIDKHFLTLPPTGTSLYQKGRLICKSKVSAMNKSYSYADVCENS